MKVLCLSNPSTPNGTSCSLYYSTCSDVDGLHYSQLKAWCVCILVCFLPSVLWSNISVLLHWVTCSSSSPWHTILFWLCPTYTFLLPQILARLEQQMWINPPLKIVPNKIHHFPLFLVTFDKNETRWKPTVWLDRVRSIVAKLLYRYKYIPGYLMFIYSSLQWSQYYLFF